MPINAHPVDRIPMSQKERGDNARTPDISIVLKVRTFLMSYDTEVIFVDKS
jgi:hypothetical protein